MSKFDDLTLEQLRAQRIKVFRQGRGTRPEAALLEIDGQRAVLKDFGHSDPWFRILLGNLMASREARALQQLADVPGIPRLLRRVGGRAVLMEYIEGQAAKDIPHGSLDSAVFERILALVEAMHHQGVAHCDLRSGGNTIIAPDGQPYFVDFVAHFVRGRRWNLLWRWAFARFCEADRTGVVRLKRRLAPELLTAEDELTLLRDKNHPLARTARFIGGSIRDISRFFLTRRKTKL